jgi:tRNA threonylcarbamoyladenosine dehydratase
MLHAFSRTEMLLGKPAMAILANSRVAVFGIGGVGTFAVEGLVRSGIGKFLLVDDDQVCLTNLNRQIHATRKTIGKHKVDMMRDRILEINPKAEVTVMKGFYMAEKRKSAAPMEPVENPLYWEDILRYHQTPGNAIDYIIDAIDTVSAKLDLVVKAKPAGIRVISSMGAGNKLDPTRLEVADIYKTVNCPLARIMRKELRRRGIQSLKVVYSQEEPMTPFQDEDNSCDSNCVCPSGTTRTCSSRRSIPGSVSFVPSVAGLIMAGEVIKDFIAVPSEIIL